MSLVRSRRLSHTAYGDKHRLSGAGSHDEKVSIMPSDDRMVAHATPAMTDVYKEAATGQIVFRTFLLLLQ